LLRKERVLEALQLLCVQRPAQGGVLRHHLGFSAEEVAEWAEVDRTNASRDLNLLAQEGKVERIPGRPVLFAIKEFPSINRGTTRQLDEHRGNNGRQDPPFIVGPPSQFKGSQKAEAPPVSLPLPERSLRSALQFSQEPGKPFAVAASIQVGAIVTSFETLIGGSQGLKVAVQQAKAAMLYPPHGLHTLLYGPSGVGKTTFARLMHVFAQELKALPSDAPFISFNCADYAGNPQLLMAHLFGVVRGAYTGADRDRVGLVEQAHRGILFLDEVHRLPPEGQEMLFHLMDRERFRRLGDVVERHSSLLLLAATTEDPGTVLLPTFRRRIPMTINLPGLHERSMMERYELLRAFFTTECSGIGANIQVAPQALQALLLYECPGNVGQLRTDVQLACARAYLEYRTNNAPELCVDLDILPDHVRRGLFRTAELHRALESTGVINHAPTEATHIFTPTGLSLDSLPESAQDLYATISHDLSTLRRSGLAENEISRLLHLDIQRYFQRFADQVAQERPGAASHLVDERIAAISRHIVQYAEEQLARVFPEKLALVLAMHLTSTLECITSGRQIDGPVIQMVRRTYPIEYEVARMALLQFSPALGMPLPESETDVLAVLLANADALLGSEQSTVGIVVAAHGRGIASGLAELSNTLVGVNSVRWVELTLEQSPEELVGQVADWVRVADQGGGVLLLVDFASLLSLGELVTRQTGVQVRAVSGVSAPLVVEAVRRAQRPRHLTLDQLAASLTLTGDELRKSGAWKSRDEKSVLYQRTVPESLDDSDFTSLPTPRVILSVCLTGFGSAAKIAELIEERLPGLRQQRVEIVCMDISLVVPRFIVGNSTQADVQRLIGDRNVVAIVGTINPHLENYPFIALTDFLFGDGVTRLRTLLGETLIDPALLQPPLIDHEDAINREPCLGDRYPTPASSAPLGEAINQESCLGDRYPMPTANEPICIQRPDLMREIAHTLSEHLLFLNPARAVPLIERMIELIEVEVGETFDIEVLAGLVLHLACIMERGVQHVGLLVSETVRTQVEQQFPRELSVCRSALQVLSAQMARPLPDEEAYNIVGILRQVDIFISDAQ
jgi:transcriptional regulator with AAA-type ATPase domain/transcriptional regulatory protein LevR